MTFPMQDLKAKNTTITASIFKHPERGVFTVEHEFRITFERLEWNGQSTRPVIEMFVDLPADWRQFDGCGIEGMRERQTRRFTELNRAVPEALEGSVNFGAKAQFTRLDLTQDKKNKFLLRGEGKMEFYNHPEVGTPDFAFESKATFKGAEVHECFFEGNVSDEDVQGVVAEVYAIDGLQPPERKKETWLFKPAV